MKLSELLTLGLDIFIKHGDLDVEIGLLNANGSVQFNHNIETFLNKNKNTFEICSQVDDEMKEFKNNIKPLYRYSRK